MVNSKEFTKRLEKIINHYDESASSFAEKIGVQRSSISHILSGRNKPSLDFVMKILSAYPDVELYWLLNGKGSFGKKQPEAKSNNLSTKKDLKEKMPAKTRIQEKDKIDYIVVFYKDGTFKKFLPSE